MNKEILKKTYDILTKLVEDAKKKKTQSLETKTEAKTESFAVGSIESLISALEEKIKRTEQAELQQIIEAFSDILNKVDGKKEEIDETAKTIRETWQNIDEKIGILGKEIEKKIPVPFNQDDIAGLSFDRLNHIDGDHKLTAKTIGEIKEKVGGLGNLLNANNLNLKKEIGFLETRLGNLRDISKHNDLEEIGSDDHHSEEHLLESHIGLKITTSQLNRLVDGDEVDDLHRHKALEQRLITTGGPSLAVLDARYIKTGGAALTASEIVGTDASSGLVSLAVATYPSLTELSYVKGVTSAIQTQFTGKAATDQTMYIGTTAVAINRASAALTLAGITLAGATMTDLLILATGTATMAPIKFVAGTNLTTPIAGVMEFDGTDLFITI